MVSFVNAKINIGLQITGRRADGYHDLQTIFYPVGLYAGTPQNQVSFCDALEILPAGMGEGIKLHLSGNPIDCPVEKNLVYKAVCIYLEHRPDLVPDIDIWLDKHLPDQAGMGGGSADAAFTLRALSELEREFTGFAPTERELSEMALALGADCPYFLLNKPAFASGVGERLTPIPLDLSGKWLMVVKPKISISTREAFAGVVPEKPEFDLRTLAKLQVSEWRDCVINAFEKSIFPKYPELGEIKENLYASGAVYASMTGSGSCIYGIFDTEVTGRSAESLFATFPTIEATWLLRL
ncbi:MAG: 4-(cytidine 5'-diphospho)-2-C-methyl-D-erythritol kinase [Muribaculaceae bacterium]|nr:4-(cytidine 5'-diphospho)-2-C-methyl-D-erythritol kinase [Muribaculaceae bacterium]